MSTCLPAAHVNIKNGRHAPASLGRASSSTSPSVGGARRRRTNQPQRLRERDAIGARRRTSIHFRPFSFPSLQIFERGASRSPSNVYVEFGSSCPINAWMSKCTGFRRGERRWRRLQRADRRGTHGDEVFQFLLWLRRSRILRSIREFVLQLLYERHGGGRKGVMRQAPAGLVGYTVGARDTMTSISAVSQGGYTIAGGRRMVQHWRATRGLWFNVYLIPCSTLVGLSGSASAALRGRRTYRTQLY